MRSFRSLLHNMATTQKQTEQQISAAQSGAVQRWLRGLMQNRGVLCGVGGSLIAVAWATLNSPSLPIIHAAQTGSADEVGDGMVIVPRNASTGTPTFLNSGFQNHNGSRASKESSAEPIKAGNRATLQRPVLTQNASAKTDEEFVQPSPEPNYIYSSSHRSVSYSPQEQPDQLLEIPAPWPPSNPGPSSPVQLNSRRPGLVPPVPQGVQPVPPLAPVASPAPARASVPSHVPPPGRRPNGPHHAVARPRPGAAPAAPAGPPREISISCDLHQFANIGSARTTLARRGRLVGDGQLAPRRGLARVVRVAETSTRRSIRASGRRRWNVS